MNVEVPAPSVGVYADIVIHRDDNKTNPYIVVECKKMVFLMRNLNKRRNKRLLILALLKAPFAICVAGNTRRAMETEKWNNENPEIATIADIPISYGEIEEWRYKAGDPVWDIKPVDQSALKAHF